MKNTQPTNFGSICRLKFDCLIKRSLQFFLWNLKNIKIDFKILLKTFQDQILHS